MESINSYEEYKNTLDLNSVKKIIFRHIGEDLFLDDIIKFNNLEKINVEQMFIKNIETIHYMCEHVKKIKCLIRYDDVFISIKKKAKLKLSIIGAENEVCLLKLCNYLPNNIDTLLFWNGLLQKTKLENLPSTLKKIIIVQEKEEPYLPILDKLCNIKLPNNCKIKLMTEVYFGIRFNDYYFKKNRCNYNVTSTNGKIIVEYIPKKKYKNTISTDFFNSPSVAK